MLRILARFCLRGVDGVAFGRSFAAASTKAANKKPSTTTKTPKSVTGYTLFMKHTAGKLREMGLPFSELSRRIGKEWTELAPEIRQSYIDEASEYNAALQPHKKSTKRESGSANAYGLFVKSVWPSVVRDHPESSFGERSRIVASLWRNLPEEEKAQRKADASAAKP